MLKKFNAMQGKPNTEKHNYNATQKCAIIRCVNGSEVRLERKY